MKTLNAQELCAVVGMPYARFDSLRRRYRKQFEEWSAANPVVIDHDAPRFPVEANWMGKHAAHEFDDALRLLLVTKLEDHGMTFDGAMKVALQPSILQDIENFKDTDFWIGRQFYINTGADFKVMPVVSGSYKQVSQPEFEDEELEGVIAVNATSAFRELCCRFTALGYEPDQYLPTSLVTRSGSEPQ